MGTNAAFGGSGTAAWKQVREEWAGLPSDSGDGGSDDRATQNGDGASYDALASALATALISEDPDARRMSVPTFPLSSILPSGRIRAGGGGGGGGGGGRGTASGSAGGGRRVTGQAARGGSAIGAATAYRNRDADSLAQFGLSLDELDSMSPRMRCSRILDMAIGDAGHPDEQAMRQASLDQVKALVANDATAKDMSGLEALRGFIGELTVRLGLVELTDQYASKSITAAEAHKREKGLRQWVRAKIGRLNLGTYGRVNPTEFHQVARQMAADALRLMRGL